MTPSEIDNLQPGRELDALVAEKVMGWIYAQRKNWPNQKYWYKPHEARILPGYPDLLQIGDLLPHYSTSISAAWEVVGELNKRGFRVTITTDWDGDCEQIILEAGDCNCPYKKPYDKEDGHGYTLIDDDIMDVVKPPLAISRAALKAVMK